MLTNRQQQLLLFIAKRLERDGVAPSFDEMRAAVGLASKSGVHRLITSLVERGFLRRLPNRARALEVMRLPSHVDQRAPRPVTPRFKGSALAGGRLDGAGKVVPFPTLNTVPLLGRIAAGTPIEALREAGRQVDVPPHLLARGEHYALEVSGDSMTGLGILDGDIVLIRRQDTADDGTVVVALIDEQEATLKTLRRRGAQCVLEAANPAHPNRTLEAGRVRVQGRLVGLLRRYS